MFQRGALGRRENLAQKRDVLRHRVGWARGVEAVPDRVHVGVAGADSQSDSAATEFVEVARAHPRKEGCPEMGVEHVGPKANGGGSTRDGGQGHESTAPRLHGVDRIEPGPLSVDGEGNELGDVEPAAGEYHAAFHFRLLDVVGATLVQIRQRVNQKATLSPGSAGENRSMPTPHVVAVSRDERHRFSKVPREAVTLVEDFGVVGDAHSGATVQHRSRKRWTPELPNLRQVHLLPAELFEVTRELGYDLGPGDLGENVLTAGIDLHALPRDTRLDLGDATVRVTGLRNPCVQINRFREGLMKAVLFTVDGEPTAEPVRGNDRRVVRRAGVMAVVERGGEVTPGAAIAVRLPDGDPVPLQPV
jgi:MOSC domain-containing protein YiiM